MRFLKLICLTIVHLIKQIGSLPQSFQVLINQRRKQIVRNEFEAERLDRIRNPSKYLGKG